MPCRGFVEVADPGFLVPPAAAAFVFAPGMPRKVPLIDDVFVGLLAGLRRPLGRLLLAVGVGLDVAALLTETPATL